MPGMVLGSGGVTTCQGRYAAEHGYKLFGFLVSFIWNDVTSACHIDAVFMALQDLDMVKMPHTLQFG